MIAPVRSEFAALPAPTFEERGAVSHGDVEKKEEDPASSSWEEPQTLEGRAELDLGVVPEAPDEDMLEDEPVVKADKDGAQLHLSEEAVAARAREIPVMPPRAEEPDHRAECVLSLELSNAHSDLPSKFRVYVPSI